MLIVLLVAVLLCALLALVLFKMDVLSPSFLISGVFAFGTVMAIIGNINWGVEVSLKAVLIIFLGLLSIVFGEFFARKLFGSGKVYYSKTYYFEYSRKLYFVLLIIQFVLTVLYFRRIMSIASSMGETTNIWTLVMRIRVATINQGEKVGTFFSIFGNISTAITFYGIFFLINSYENGSVLKHIFKNKLALLSLTLYFFSQLISGARNGYILFAVFLLITLLLCLKKRKGRIHIFHLLFFGALLISIVFVVFSIIGVGMGKTAETKIVDELVRYSGGSIVGLSVWLDTGEPSSFFGQESFWGLRHLLHMVFPSVFDGPEFYEAVTFTNSSGINIFTGFRAFYSDFSYFGILIIPFLVGFIYSFSLKKIITKYHPISVVLYSYMFYFFVNLLFAPSVTSDLFTSSQISTIFWIIVIGFVLVPKKQNAENRLPLMARVLNE